MLVKRWWFFLHPENQKIKSTDFFSEFNTDTVLVRPVDFPQPIELILCVFFFKFLLQMLQVQRFIYWLVWKKTKYPLMCYINPKQRIIAYSPICCGLWKWKRTKRGMERKKSDKPKKWIITITPFGERDYFGTHCVFQNGSS